MLIQLIERVSHKIWRHIVKRERRRRGRQRKAQERDLKYQEEQAALLQDPTFVAELERIELLEEEARRMEEQEAARMKEEWQLRDAALHSKFLREKQKRLLQKEQQEKQEALIKKEWEEKQKKEKEEEEKRKEEQTALLQAATGSLGEREGEEMHNPEPPPGFTRKDYTHQKGEPCPFFSKTGACRFGIQCSREHEYPESSRTILLPNMYSHFGMEQLSFEGNDADIALEYTDSETYEHFREFFDDTLPEFQRCGNVIQFKVCCNTSSHLRGNVYVQYSKEEDALQARAFFNGRWYAGRQLTCLFVTIDRWKSALCGLFWRQRCPKGGQCNFLHVYRNPGNAFWRADQDTQSHEYSKNSQTPKYCHRGHSERSIKSRRRRGLVKSPHRSRSASEIESSGSDNTPRRQSPKPKSRSKRSRSRSKRSRSRSKRSRSRSKRSRSRSKRSRSRTKRSRSRSKRSRSRSKRSRSRSKQSRSRSKQSRSRSKRSRSGSKLSSSRSESSRSDPKRLKYSSEKSQSRSERPTNISDKSSTDSVCTQNSCERTASKLEKLEGQLTSSVNTLKSTNMPDRQLK
ncbi:U2 small nuclear ribonucleoprotein auxiliary factor 35 kDa subunit-related protein 2 [Procambarus clarkii]|uniref:U2 small nuclear ribonucleoprotein auxiliary factor 35 kDa subunit-related protein 2 n=1 Tax=Procambarus clarkii TaxID=6728 RepID=UPI001E6766D2|nr:U2 small nuclear ribonucleoprotein auxiliary factor 35 kDa subunit-related protein 2-like [Procambarus clarkii]XP_045582470.1 U2 small nuclear ribonucleoprotein auxiliary factor 35 kDa subunit-related protein 2-like [Procambarus clarkii]